MAGAEERFLSSQSPGAHAVARRRTRRRISAGPSENDPNALRYLTELRELCRIPDSAKTLLMKGDLFTCLSEAPQSDMDILGLPKNRSALQFVREAVEKSRSSCIFTQDSGQESVLV
ncbi:MAG: hypothetical protein WBM46_15210 [Polyangiales bacterium]